MIDRLRSELERKCDVIKSMEMAHNTMRYLIEDKNDVIESQKQIIKDIQNDTDTDRDSIRSKLEEARDIIVQKDIVLDKCNEEIASVEESLSSVGDRKMEHLTHQLESERQLNQDMVKKLEDQVIITNKTELAFSTQTNLVNAKNDIIQNLKIIIAQHKKEAGSCLQLHEGDLTSHLEANSPSNLEAHEQEITMAYKIPANLLRLMRPMVLC